jgi:hypothetical protein
MGNKVTGAYLPKAILFFLIPFTLIWSGISIYGLYIKPFLEGKLKPEEMLFGLPFIFGTIILLSVIITLLFGSLKVTIGRNECTVFLGAGNIGWKRKFAPSDVKNIIIALSDVKINNQPQNGIKIILENNKDIIFGTTIKEPQKEYIAAVLRKELLEKDSYL